MTILLLGKKKNTTTTTTKGIELPALQQNSYLCLFFWR